MNMHAVKVLYRSLLQRNVLLATFNVCRTKLNRSFPSRSSHPKYWLSSLLPPLLTLSAWNKSTNDVIKEADDLYNANKFDELHELLASGKDSDNPEILWRLARAKFETCRDMKSAEKLQALEEALELVDKALAAKEDCWAAHKWRAILLDYVWRHKSTKGRIIHSFDVKKHMERAIELNPTDSTSYYLLGEWCYTFADMPWYQRKAAATIFANPPTSSYEEALKYFKKAEEMSPMFYSMNLLMLGKCLLKLDMQGEAIEYLKKAEGYPIKTADDKRAKEEATKLLKAFKVQ